MNRTCTNHKTRVTFENFAYPFEVASELMDLGYRTTIDHDHKAFHVEQAMDDVAMFDLFRKAVHMDRGYIYRFADFVLEGNTLSPMSKRAKEYWAEWQEPFVVSINLEGDSVIRKLESMGYRIARVW